MSGYALAFDEDVLRLGANPALSPDATRDKHSVFGEMSVSMSNNGFSRPSDTLSALFRENLGAANAIDAQTISQAFALLEALPSWVPAPELAIESDGQIGFDWHCSSDRVLSLNVGRTGMIGYAALNGLESTYGRLPFGGVLPERIRTLLHLVRQETEASSGL